jgi:hypothetical protein
MKNYNMGRLTWGVELKPVTGEKMWSIGCCLSHWDTETYLYVNLFKWTLTIGKFIKYDE